jgi:hypothetical protein
MEPYSSRSTTEVFVPQTEWVADRVLVLPGGPSITDGQVSLISRILGVVVDAG